MMQHQFTDGDKVVGSTQGETDYRGLGLAITSLVLGIISIPFSVILIGGICGLVGLVLAAIHLRKRYFLRPMAWWGLALSIIGILAATGLGIYFISEVRQYKETMTLLESQSYDEWTGQKTPDFTLKDVEGNTISLSGLKGRRVIVNLWATWCPPCRMEMPHFVKLRNMYDANDLYIIGVSLEDEKAVRSFKDKHGINYSIVAATTKKNLPAPYADATSVPTTFFIDRNGIIRYVANGYRDFKSLNSFVAALDSKKEPNEPQNLTTER